MFYLGLPVSAQSFQEEWENGQLSFPPWVQEGHSNSLSTDYALSGGFSYKSELPTQVYNNARSELRFEGNGVVPKFQDQFTTWGISFSVYFPSDFKADPVKESILQLKDIMDPCDIAGGNPPFKIGLENYELSATVRWTDQRCATELGLEYFGKLMQVQPGKWHHFVLNVGWDYRDNGNGYFELYASVDSPPTPDDRILNYRGPTGYNNNFGHYLKLGIYKWLWKKDEYVKKSRAAGVRERVLYYDNISIKENKIGLSLNKEPSADAGPSKVITLPNNEVVFHGSATDSDGDIIKYQWEQVSGPSDASLSHAETESLHAGDLVEGTYVFRLNVTDNLGADAYDQVFVEVQPPVNLDPEVNAGPDQTIILPNNKVTLKGTVSNVEHQELNYQWSQLSGPDSAGITPLNHRDVEVQNLVEGTYVFQLMVKDTSGIINSDEVEVTLLAAAPMVTAEITDATCNAADGAIVLKMNGGKGPFHYQWSNGVTSKDNQRIKAGTYQVTITDGNGTKTEKSFKVKANQVNIVLSAEISKATCSNNDGAITVKVKGGTSPYKFRWSNGAETATIKNLPAGKYLLTVTDKNGCSEAATYHLGVEPGRTEFKLTSEVNNANCSGEGGSIFLKMSNGNQGYSFTWTTGDTGPNLTGLEIGRYQVLIKDKHGCFMKKEFTILQDELPTPRIRQNGNILSINQQADFYQWYKEGVVIEGANQKELKITESGSYLVQTALGTKCTATSEPLQVETIESSQPAARVSQIIEEVNLFPNPVTDQMNLQLKINGDAETKVAMHDFMGNVVMTHNFGSIRNYLAQQLNLSSYPAGVYIIKVTAATEVVSRRLIKK